MSDEYQIPIPASFHALYADSRGRLTEPLARYRARYELCEDMAQMLVERCQEIHHDQGVCEELILWRMHAGLCMPDAGFSAREALWVVTRLAELMAWECPVLDT
jgi:hypothetical protein